MSPFILPKFWFLNFMWLSLFNPPKFWILKCMQVFSFVHPKFWHLKSKQFALFNPKFWLLKSTYIIIFVYYAAICRCLFSFQRFVYWHLSMKEWSHICVAHELKSMHLSLMQSSHFIPKFRWFLPWWVFLRHESPLLISVLMSNWILLVN